MIQERTSNGVPTVAYTRGPDLSGTLEGAGGIGGLLARSEWNSASSTWSRHAFYHSDGVGNVTALAVPSGGDIALAGSYRYDPFGRLIGTPTDLAARNTQRFSSKDWHNASGFYYFGYRFYDPATQRWLNRDPIGEEGGVNLYGYVGNNPISGVDPLGLSNVRITDASGNVTILDNPSNADLRNTIGGFADGSIADFSVLGHGSHDAMVIGPGRDGNGIYLDPDSNAVVWDDDGSSFSDTLRNKLAKDGRIHLRGCRTAAPRLWTGKKNISNQTAFELPGRTAIGSGTWRLGPVEPFGYYTGIHGGVTLPISYNYSVPSPIPRTSNVNINNVAPRFP